MIGEIPKGNARVLTAKKKIEELKKQKQELEQKEFKLEAVRKKKEFRELVLGDLYLFAKTVLGFEDLYEPLHRPLCQTIANSSIKRKLILLPRGHFKTTIIAISYPIWCLCRNPCERIILASTNASKAKESLEEIVERIDTDAFQSIFGDTVGRPDSWVRKREEQIRIKRKGKVTGPSILCLGIESDEVGRHGSKIICDDIVGQDQVNTIEGRKKAWDWFTRQYSVLDPDSELIVLGTRWHTDDVYSRILNLPNWHIEKRQVKENGKYIFPTRFNDKVMREIEEIQNPYTYSCFYLNDPVGEDITPFNIEKFHWEDYPAEDQNPGPEWTYAFVDPASTVEDYSCPTGIIIGSAVNTKRGKKFIIREAISRKIPPDQLIEFFFNLYNKYKYRTIVIESEAQQATFLYWLNRERVRRGMSFFVRDTHAPRNLKREKRIWGLQPFLHGGAISFWKEMPGKEKVIEEFNTYPRGRTNDLVLATSFIPLEVSYPPKWSRPDKERKVPVRSRLLTELMQKARKPRRRGRLPSVAPR